MAIGLKILETPYSFHQKVVDAICDEMNDKIMNVGVALAIRNDVANNIKPIFTNTKDYNLFLNDPFIIADMGLPQGKREQILDRVLQQVADSIFVSRIKFHSIGGNISGGFNIGIVMEDYLDLLALNESYIVSKNGVNEWLRWILLEGAKPMQSEYRVRYVAGTGRSGQGCMVLKGVFTVDTEIQGTANNNWLTRAMKVNESALEQILINAAQKQIERVI